jgi:hypothetical protein
MMPPRLGLELIDPAIIAIEPLGESLEHFGKIGPADGYPDDPHSGSPKRCLSSL